MLRIGPHLVTTANLNREHVDLILDTASEFYQISRREVKKVPTLRGKTVMNVFLEPSTRTRVSFELAAKRLSADAINLSGSSSSTSKGETLIDTIASIRSMQPDVIVLRHGSSGAAKMVSDGLSLSDPAVINAGDGEHEHPTQALLDLLSLRSRLGTLDNLVVSMVGDVMRSRVARSLIYLLRLFGAEIRAVGPATLARPEFKELGVIPSYSLESGLKGANVVVSLRIKKEYGRMNLFPSMEEYARHFCISEEKLSRLCPNAVVIAPGPFIRGIEIDSDVVDGPRSLVLDQVENGVAVRMAVLYLLISGR